MEKNSEKKTKGKLIHLIHEYDESTFKKTILYIKEENDYEAQDFYGYVPETIRGKKVLLYQNRGEKGLFQKLTHVENNIPYQIKTRLKEFPERH